MANEYYIQVSLLSIFNLIFSFLWSRDFSFYHWKPRAHTSTRNLLQVDYERTSVLKKYIYLYREREVNIKRASKTHPVPETRQKHKTCFTPKQGAEPIKVTFFYSNNLFHNEINKMFSSTHIDTSGCAMPQKTRKSTNWWSITKYLIATQPETTTPRQITVKEK